MERITKEDLNPSTPQEFAEALLRICEGLMENYEKLQEGNGIGTESDLPETVTDIFYVIRGCADCAIDLIKIKHTVDQI